MVVLDETELIINRCQCWRIRIILIERKCMSRRHIRGLFFSLMRLNLTSLPIATVSRITINMVIFCSWHIFQFTRTSDNCVWFYSKSSILQRSGYCKWFWLWLTAIITIFLFWIFIGNFSKIIFFHVYSCWSFSSFMESLCAALSGRFAERSIGVPRHIFVYLISGIAGVCCME